MGDEASGQDARATGLGLGPYLERAQRKPVWLVGERDSE